ncbi:MAG TPA: lysylphosphatidylglycerol synthase transmembrane domain-containing protein [Acidimicrobiales bacterium]
MSDHVTPELAPLAPGSADEVAESWPSLRRAFQLYASPAGEVRARRPTDVILLILSVASLTLLVIIERPGSGPLTSALIDVVRALPDELNLLWELLYFVMSVWAAALVVVAAVRRRWTLVRDMGLTVVAIVLIVPTVARLATGEWLGLFEGLAGADGSLNYPPLRYALVVALVVTTSPHLTRSARLTGRGLLLLGGVATLALENADATGFAAGYFVGLGAAAAIHLLFGSPGGKPGLEQVRADLQDLGLRVHELRPGRVDQDVYEIPAEDDQGPIEIKVFGRDAWEGQILTRLWRRVWYRGAEGLWLRRGQEADHEAALLMLAADRGVAVPQVVAAGRSANGDTMLVVRPVGSVLAEAGPLEAGRAAATWDALATLHRAGMAHGAIDPTTVRVDGDRIVLADLLSARLSRAPEPRLADRTQLLVTLAVLGGTSLAVESALAALGSTGVSELLPLIQPAALSRGLRKVVKQNDFDLEGLRQQAGAAAGVEVPKLQELRRITWKSLVGAALFLLVAWILVSSFTDIDWGAVWTAVQEATLVWLVVALLFSQLGRVGQGVAVMGACPAPLPLGPTITLQFGLAFVNLAVPSTAGRVATNVRYFQRAGVAPGTAVASGLVESMMGFVVQITLLATILLLNLQETTFFHDRAAADDSSSGRDWGVLGFFLVLVVLAVATILVVPKWRRRAFEFVHQLIAGFKVLASPTKVALVFGGNVFGELVSAISIGMVAHALGESVSLGDLLVINICVSLFNGLMPVPGGIGVVEAALAAGLTATGIDSSTAMAIALLHRMNTFYLPPLWGAGALGWLRKERYL